MLGGGKHLQKAMAVPSFVPKQTLPGLLLSCPAEVAGLGGGDARTKDLDGKSIKASGPAVATGLGAAFRMTSEYLKEHCVVATQPLG